MNILFLTKELPYPPNSGHRVRSFHLLKGLARDHQVSLIAFGEEHANSDSCKILQQYCKNIQLVPSGPPVSLARRYGLAFLNIFSVLPFAVASRHSSRMKREVEAFLRAIPVDAVFCDGMHQACHLPWSAKMQRWILGEHNIESTIIRRYFQTENNILKRIYAGWEWLKMRRFETSCWKIFDQCLVCSEIDKEIILDRLPETDVKIVPNGVDIAFFSPRQIKREPHSLVYTGLMNWHPNEDAVLYFLNEIYPKVKAEIPDVRFWIVGNQPPENVKRIARSDPSVTVTGFVGDVRPYVLQSEVFVVPLRIGSGTRLKILEAFSMRKAVVSTAIGCEGIDVENGKNVFIADSADEFARRIVELCKDGVLREMLESNGRRLVEEKYSWDKIIEHLSRIVG